MAKKIKDVSISKIENVLSVYGDNDVDLIWNDVEIAVKKTLGIKDAMTFVANVTALCFSNDGEEYMPEVRDFAIRSQTILSYTNVRLPENIERRYNIVYMTDLYETVVGVINKEQYEQMLIAADDKIEHIATANIEMVNMRLNESVSAFSELCSKVEDIFGGVSREDIASMVDALSNIKNVDEATIAKAIVDVGSGK